MTRQSKYQNRGVTQRSLYSNRLTSLDDLNTPPSEMTAILIGGCREYGLLLIVGLDANAYNVLWGSTGTNNRGESLLQFLIAFNIDILNKDNKPSIVNGGNQSIIMHSFCGLL